MMSAVRASRTLAVRASMTLAVRASMTLAVKAWGAGRSNRAQGRTTRVVRRTWAWCQDIVMGTPNAPNCKYSPV
jgi:acyl-CoA hydrolase